MGDSTDVTLEAANSGDAHALSNLLELYVQELSGIFEIEPGPDGRFGYDNLPLYWSEPETHLAFFIHSHARPAGFALVTRGSPATADPADLDLAEFYVLPSHRGSGVGRQGAFALWNRLPGRWVVRVSEANEAALVFWETTIAEYTQGAFSRSTYGGRLHEFRVFSFRSSATPAAV